MIEAVNSVLANAPLLRGTAEGQSSASPVATSGVERVETPYISPYIKVDISHNKAVIQLRDASTGDVVQQIPSETRLEAQRKTTQNQQVQAALAESETDPEVAKAAPKAAPAAPVSAPEAPSAETSAPSSTATTDAGSVSILA